VSGVVSWLSGCVDVAGSVDGSPVVSNACSGGASQQVTVVGDGSLRLAGRCVGVKGGAVTQYAAIVVSGCDGSAGQSWVWRADDSVFNPVSGFCLSVPSSSSVAGTKLQLLSCARAAGQRWWESAVRPLGPVTGVAALCLSGKGNVTSAGTPLVVSGCTGGGYQQVQVPGNGSLQVAGACLDVTSSKYVVGTPIQLWTCNAGGSQGWLSPGDGTIRNATSGLCLAAASGSAGAAVQLATCTGDPTQRWTLPTS
jgi:hypothetical protein